MPILTALAHAKLNLTLDVLGRRSDGYHDLRMVMTSVALADVITLETGTGDGVRASANLGFLPTGEKNLAASALLPFLPMMSVHLIFLNLIYDLSCTAIPWDNVDEEFIAKPRKWDASSVGSFMIWIGPTSSIFDFLDMP